MLVKTQQTNKNGRNKNTNTMSNWSIFRAATQRRQEIGEIHIQERDANKLK